MPITKRTQGFTLIELLVVIAIIGLLATIITASLSSARAKARDAKRISDIKTLQTALSLYYNDHYYYPTALSSLAPTYIAVIPTDPSTNANYKYFAITTGLNGTLCNNTPSLAVMYHIGAALEITQNSAQLQDVDAAASSNVCGGASDFNGQTLNCVGSQLSSTPNDSTVSESCYDFTP